MRADVEAVLNRLTADERTDLIECLMKRVQKQARSDALVISDLLESELKVAGYRDLAEKVKAIREVLLHLNAEADANAQATHD